MSQNIAGMNPVLYGAIHTPSAVTLMANLTDCESN